MMSVPVEDFETGRSAARRLLGGDIRPGDVTWSRGLFDGPLDLPSTNATSTVPQDFLELAKTVAMHRDEGRWDLLCRVLYRVTRGERNLLEIEIAGQVRDLNLMAKAVERAMH